MALQLTESHFSEAVRSDKAHRIEVLPVSWHAKLHGKETGIDERLSNITLPSVPKMRHLANDAIADVLFYTSPVYCQVNIQHPANQTRLQASFSLCSQLQLKPCVGKVAQMK